MVVLQAFFLGFLNHALAQSVVDPAAAATTELSAPTGICADENGLLSCIPPQTVCPGTIPASVSSCGCTNVQTVINCYSTFCPAQLTEDELMLLSSDSAALCHGIGTVAIPSGIISSSVPSSPLSTTAVITAATNSSTGQTASTGTGSSKGVASTGTGTNGAVIPTSAGVAASSTSKATGERGTGHAIPVLGGLLGALLGVVGLFLLRDG
ncbi:hypothetical protein G7Y89_g11214 [Cudoniella acicularis]|uniref:Extracellular membrane protein CFEM domain-containing protein n=1 Tax=Cudoniella acicularis TaxID=354080 RepID=A0A8H4RCS2_9HELO|nr:hypothetical protein G7Y89_g11214 [Cudoniella acicularis]